MTLPPRSRPPTEGFVAVANRLWREAKVSLSSWWHLVIRSSSSNSSRR